MAKKRAKINNAQKMQNKTQNKSQQTQHVTLDDVNKKWFEKRSDWFKNGAWDIINNNPYINNQRIKRLNTQPAFLDREATETLLRNPGDNDRALRMMSWSLMGSVYPYYKMVKMYSDILLYNHYTYPKYVTADDIKKKDFKSESKLVNQYMDRLNPKYNFRRIAMETTIEGKRAYVIRDSFDKKRGTVDYAILQALPSDWWKVTGKSEYSYYSISFDFSYFWQAGANPDQFPKFFQDIYGQLVSSINYNGSKVRIKEDAILPSMVNYEYSKELDSFMLWVDLPADVAWCFSVDESNAWQVPPFIGMFLSLQDLNSYQYLQTQLTSIPLYGILTGEVPLNEKNKSGTHINDFAISPEVFAGEEYRSEGMLPAGVGALYTPVTNVKLHQFQEQVGSSKIYGDAMQQQFSTAGLTGIMSTTDKPTIAMVKTAQKLERRYIDFMYEQFMNFCDVMVQNRLQTEYVWKTEIFGNVFDEKEDKDDLANRIGLGHSYLVPKFLACYNLDIESANCLASLVDATGLYEKLKVPPNAYTSSNKDGANPLMKENNGGRKTISDDEVENDNTAISKDNGSNLSENRDM